MNHDPIKIWAARLLSEGITTEEALAAIREDAMQEAKDAAAFAKSSHYPSRETITQDVYWEVDQQTANGMTGRHFFHD